MRLHKESKAKSPKVSLILLDWSVRESFHICRYLEQQTVPRDQFEILMVEYYSKLSPALLQFENSFDGIALLEMPRAHCYHKHLMYNIGFLLSKGEIVVICDSDAMVKPTFIETIIREFENNPSLVLHLDQFRNSRKDLYPFNYPSFEEVIGKGCINWHDGVTSGTAATSDLLHRRNYGACFCCRREDFIAIGGADEHVDYVGHICGPYDLTFRLSNLGRTEVWHREEFLYHTWHPGSDGTNNYFGPHDGRNVSTTALGNIALGRVSPHVINPLIAELRAGKTLTLSDICERGISPKNLRITSWEFLKDKARVAEHAHYSYSALAAENQLFYSYPETSQAPVTLTNLAKLQSCPVLKKTRKKSLSQKISDLFLFVHCAKTIVKLGIVNSALKQKPKILPPFLRFFVKCFFLILQNPKFPLSKWQQIKAQYDYLSSLLEKFSISFDVFQKEEIFPNGTIIIAGNGFQVEFFKDLFSTYNLMKSNQKQANPFFQFNILSADEYRERLNDFRKDICHFTKSALSQLQDLKCISTRQSSKE
jgi:hypothetical protein